MNSRTIQEQIANLKSADIAAYKAGVHSNQLLNFVRNELIKRAYKADQALNAPIKVEMSMTVASYIIPSLALLTKDGLYPALVTNSVIALEQGDIILTCNINADGLSKEYREKLNANLGINIPLVEEVA